MPQTPKYLKYSCDTHDINNAQSIVCFIIAIKMTTKFADSCISVTQLELDVSDASGIVDVSDIVDMSCVDMSYIDKQFIKYRVHVNAVNLQYNHTTQPHKTEERPFYKQLDYISFAKL
jgi:hypothetical protein